MYRLLYLKKIKNIYSNQMHDKSNKAKNTKKGWYYMMIKAIFIKNFKAYEKSTINLFENNIFIGENDSGKSTILQAMDVFFNQDSIDKKFVRDINQNVEIGIRIDDNNKFIKKIYKAKTFKLESIIGDINELSGVSFVYISPTTVDVKKLICDLAIAKTMSLIPTNTTDQIRDFMDEGINDVINSIDSDLIVVGDDTNFIGSPTLKLESALKFDVSSDGIPIEGRGSGYQKNVIYSLLTKSNYNNVIIGIDEIENSLSLRNAKELLSKLKQKFSQTLITTHSVSILEVVNQFEITPIYKAQDQVKTVTELYKKLGKTDKIYILVEGKTDVPWVKKVIELAGLNIDYLIIACGGCHNISAVKDELEGSGCTCKTIKDGDTKEADALKKDCIELYIPLDAYNEIFGLTAVSVPEDKKSFFESICTEQISEATVKRIISDKVSQFLTIDNPVVDEIRAMIE